MKRHALFSLKRERPKGRGREPQRTSAPADQKKRVDGPPAQLDDQPLLLVVAKLLVLVPEMGAGCVWDGPCLRGGERLPPGK